MEQSAPGGECVHRHGGIDVAELVPVCRQTRAGGNLRFGAGGEFEAELGDIGEHSGVIVARTTELGVPAQRRLARPPGGIQHQCGDGLLVLTEQVVQVAAVCVRRFAAIGRGVRLRQETPQGDSHRDVGVVGKRAGSRRAQLGLDPTDSGAGIAPTRVAAFDRLDAAFDVAGESLQARGMSTNVRVSTRT